MEPMAELLGQIIALAEDIIVAGGYAGILFVMFAEALFPPIPSELFMPFSGYLAAQGHLNPFMVWLASATGSLLGALVVYHIARAAGDTFFRRFLRAYGRWFGVGEAQYDRVLGIFQRYGEWMVLVGRMIPVVRGLISIPAGANRMPRLRFVAFTFLGASGWSGVLTLAGYWLGEHWREVTALLQSATSFIGAGLVILAVGLIVSLLVLRQRRRAAIVESPR